MKHVFIFMAALTLSSASAYAADITAAEAMSVEILHEQQVQVQMEQLQQERDAAFLKQLEAEAMIAEQQMLAEQAAQPAATTLP
ncbi:hypothetical protein D8Y20_12470 [Mariprofundus sp. EBB-1]|uniref:hypothetical protein n=1 Tax=Mariprofundus sp. EBB-1 TaxID=2650971 RepID=UPI000EF25216|nr:hypothetical protein [Mariprofundus sp. EBB-1]RLL49800.1 hypothetical protein D8Y20_12470 [Mariprofundus sp. EBB-1]